MPAYDCPYCKDTGTVTDDATLGENSGATYVCTCKYGCALYHNPLPPEPTDAYKLDRADLEARERMDAGHIATCRHCQGTFIRTEDWGGSCKECAEARDYS